MAKKTYSQAWRRCSGWSRWALAGGAWETTRDPSWFWRWVRAGGALRWPWRSWAPRTALVGTISRPCTNKRAKHTFRWGWMQNIRWTDVRSDRHARDSSAREDGKTGCGLMELARMLPPARPHNGERRAAVEIASDSADWHRKQRIYTPAPHGLCGVSCLRYCNFRHSRNFVSHGQLLECQWYVETLFGRFILRHFKITTITFDFLRIRLRILKLELNLGITWIPQPWD